MERAKRLELNQLMSGLADGDRAAFHPLFAAVWPIVTRFTGRLVGNSVDGEDAAQAALLKVFERASSYRAGSEAMTWILTIAAYECRTIRQKSRRRREDLDSGEALAVVNSDSPTPETAAIAASLSERVQDLLEGLSAQDREAIMSVIHETERPNVAEATFRKRVQRALARFKSAWEERHGAD